MKQIKLMIIDLGLDYSGAEAVLNYYLDGNTEIEPHIVTIYNGNATKRFTELYGREKVTCADLKYSKNELRFLPALAQRRVLGRLRAIENSISPDAIYVNNTLEIAIAAQYIKTTSVPAVGHIHDMKDSFGTPMKIRAVYRSLKDYRQVFTVSQACRKSWGVDELKVVYNGVPASFSLMEKKRERDSVRIGFAGMASERKGFDLLYGAITEMPENVEWEIAYNIVQENCGEYVEQLGKMSNVKLYYKLNSEEMIGFYDGISVLVIPSRADPLPTAAIEAMNRNVLVIGSRAGGIGELVGDETLLMDELSVQALKDKLLEVLSWDEEKMRKTIEKQSSRAREMFSREKKNEILNRTFAKIGK